MSTDTPGGTVTSRASSTTRPLPAPTRLRWPAAIGVSLALTILLAVASLLPSVEQTVLVGRPGDTVAIEGGFAAPAAHQGSRGRWTRGDGRLRLPRLSVPARVHLRVAAPDPRIPDTIDVVVDGIPTRHTLANGWNEVFVTTDPSRVGGDAARAGRDASDVHDVALRSTVTASAEDGAPQGVFLSRAVVRTGGFDALVATPFATLAWWALCWLAVLVVASHLGASEMTAAEGDTTFAVRGDLAGATAPHDREPPPSATSDLAIGIDALTATPAAASSLSSRTAVAARRQWHAGVAIVVVTLAGAAMTYFRHALLSRVAVCAVLCWVIALAVAITARRRETASARTGAPSMPGRDGTWVRSGSGRFALLAVVLIALLFPEAWLRGYVLSQADMFFEFQPWRAHAPEGYRPIERPPLGDVPMLVYPFTVFAQSRWRAGAFPLWTSAVSSGQPFLGTYQSALLSPFSYVAAVVPLPQATVAIAALRLIVGGLGMFLFLRAIGLSRLAAAFGGVTFLLNPFSIVWLEHPLAGVPPWLPWMLLAGERLASRPGGTSVALLAVATALVLAGGHPHTGMFVAMLGGGFAIVRAIAAGPGRLAWRPRIVGVAAASAGLALGAALVALQVLPFLEYVSLSRAATARASFTLNPFIAPASTLITAIVPNFVGLHGAGNFAGPTNYLEQQIYPGLATWLLAIAAIVGGLRDWRVWFFAGAGTLAMLVMYGAPGVLQIVSALPLVKAASLPRAGIVAIGAFTILAAMGLDAVLRAARGESPERVRAWRVSITTALVLAGAACAALALITLDSRGAWLSVHALTEFTTRWTWFAVWIAAAVVSLAVARTWTLIGRTPTGVLLIAIAALDLLLVGRGFHPLIPPAQVFPAVPEIQLIKRDRDLFRVLGAGGALMPNSAMVYGLQDIRGYDGLLVARYADLLDVVLRYDHDTHLATHLGSPLFDLLNVKYVIGVPQVEAPADWFTRLIEGEAPVYRNTRAFQRAFLVDGYAVQDGNVARRTLRDGRVDFHRIALVEQELAQGVRPVAAASLDAVGRATITAYGDHQVTVDTDAADRRLLVLMDVHYPGWEAEIDGQPAPIVRANFAFRAVSVPGGHHTVTFAYRPASFRAGLTISGAALAILAGLVVFDRRRRGGASS